MPTFRFFHVYLLCPCVKIHVPQTYLFEIPILSPYSSQISTTFLLQRLCNISQQKGQNVDLDKPWKATQPRPLFLFPTPFAVGHFPICVLPCLFTLAPLSFKLRFLSPRVSLFCFSLFLLLFFIIQSFLSLKWQ